MSDNTIRDALIQTHSDLVAELDRRPLHTETVNELGDAIRALDTIIQYENDGQHETAFWAFGAFLGRYNAMLNALQDEHGRLGLYLRAQNRQFVSVKNQEYSAEREHEWTRWREEAERIRSKNPHITSKADIARHVRKNLNLDDSIETIRKRI